MLAWLELNHGDELRADFQEYYGLNLDDMGKAYSHRHAAVLASQLRPGSRVMGAIDGTMIWSFGEHILSLIEYDLRVIAWQRSGGAGGRPSPPITMPGIGSVKVTKRQMADVARALNIEI